MSCSARETKTKNILYSLYRKNDTIGNGHMDTTKRGWEKGLEEGIMEDIRRFGVPMEYIHYFFIQYDGLVSIKYEGRVGVMEKEMNIKRSDREITDNQLRGFINDVVKDISEMVLDKADKIGYIYPDKMFYGDKVGLLEDGLPTCSILKEVTSMHGVCEKACYGSSSSGDAILPSDCRRCNIPLLFPTVAANIIKSKKGGAVSSEKTV